MGKVQTKLLKLKAEGGSVHELKVRQGMAVVVGRGGADLNIDQPSVSRQHCRFELGANGQVVLADLGSQNGTKLNGQKVTKSEVRTGDRLHVGSVLFEVEVETMEATGAVKRPVAPTERGARVEASPFGVDHPALPRVAPPGPAAPTAGAKSPAAAAKSPKGRYAAMGEEGIREHLATMGLDVEDRIEFSGQVHVFRAKRRPLDQSVIVKAVLVQDEARAARLMREAKLAAKVRHRNVVEIFDVREVPGLIAIVLEQVEGKTLDSEIKSAGRLGAARAVSIATEVSRALAHAHSLGVVHRNVTPRSVILEADGGVKLVDFALAKSLFEGTGVRKLTAIGTSLGEPEYAPIEQRRDASTADERADVYAVGATLFHMLAGEPPLVPFTLDEDEEKDNTDALPVGKIPDDVPQALRAVVARATRLNRENRYRNAEELLYALEGAMRLIDRRQPSGEASQLYGRIQGDELLELLPVLELGMKSGFLEIFGEGRQAGTTIAGTVVLRHGKIVDARSDDAHGQDAVKELLMLRNGNFSFVYGEPREHEGEEPLPISRVLLQVARMRDEASQGEASGSR